MLVIDEYRMFRLSIMPADYQTLTTNGPRLFDDPVPWRCARETTVDARNTLGDPDRYVKVVVRGSTRS